jgi:hypothetical protein
MRKNFNWSGDSDFYLCVISDDRERIRVEKTGMMKAKTGSSGGGGMAGKKGGLFIKRWIYFRLSRNSENGYKVAAQDHELYWNASR